VSLVLDRALSQCWTLLPVPDPVLFPVPDPVLLPVPGRVLAVADKFLSECRSSSSPSSSPSLPALALPSSPWLFASAAPSAGLAPSSPSSGPSSSPVLHPAPADRLAQCGLVREANKSSTALPGQLGEDQSGKGKRQ
jgi:hypothetical protein